MYGIDMRVHCIVLKRRSVWKEPVQHVEAAYDCIVLTEGSPFLLKQMHSILMHSIFLCAAARSLSKVSFVIHVSALCCHALCHHCLFFCRCEEILE